MEEILWKIAVENGADIATRRNLHTAISGAESGKNLIKAAQRVLPELRQVGKGELWGEKLMDFAWANPEKINEATGLTEARPLVEAVKAALYSLGANHQQTRALYRVAPSTGKPIKRLK